MSPMHPFARVFWLAQGLAVIFAIARGFLQYRAWPTADGEITRLDIDRKRGADASGGHYYCATFTYDFRDPQGTRLSAIGTKTSPPKPTLANSPNENCPSERKLPSGSAQKIPTSTAWNWTSGPTPVTVQAPSQCSQPKSRTPVGRQPPVTGPVPFPQRSAPQLLPSSWARGILVL